MQCYHVRRLLLFSNIEDFTRVLISYEIYETNLRRVSSISYEMITSVRFCLSYDPLKGNFIVFKMNIMSIRKRIVDTDVLITLRVRAKVLLHVWAYDFYDLALSTE